MNDIASCYRIDPTIIPHIAVGHVRVSGNETFARLTEREYAHFHVRGTRDFCAGMRELGANGYILLGPARGLGSDRYELTLKAVVAHAGSVSAADRTAYFPSGRASLISHVFPGWHAERQGLRAGDLVARLDGQLLSGPDPQVELLRRTRALAMGATLALDVLRSGKLERIELTREERGLFGYYAVTVPILDPVP